MRTTVFVLAVASLSLAACAGVSSGSAPDERLTQTFNGTVNGVIVLPQKPGVSCTELTVYATTADGAGAAQAKVGRPSVHEGNGRCSYQIDKLPPLPIDVHVDPAPGMTCGDGSSLSFGATSVAALTIEAHTSVTRDFRAQCGARS
jgi:hypothetical protein